MIKVSVIIPVYNVEKYLRECIDSVLNQTYSEFEVILVNDGSTDSSGEICKDYEHDSRVIVINQENGGLSAARNTGLKHAVGDYVYFLDSDDYIALDTLEILVHEAETTQDDCICFDADVFNETENKILNPDFYHRSPDFLETVSGPELLYKLIKQGAYRSSVPLLFIRREVISSGKLQFYNGLLHEDELFTIQLLLKVNQVHHIPLAMYKRRMRDESITTVKMSTKNVISFCVIIDELQKVIIDNGDYIVVEAISLRIENFLRRILKGISCLNKRDKRQIVQHLFVIQANTDRYKNGVHQKIISNCISCNRNRLKYKTLIFFKKKYRAIQRVIMFGNKSFHGLITILISVASKERKALLIGTPEHRNLGDHAIALVSKQLIEKTLPNHKIFELSMSFSKRILFPLSFFIKKDIILFIPGGGWLGNVWFHNEVFVQKILKRFKKNKIVILPQTVYWDETITNASELQHCARTYYNHNDLLFFTREKRSYEFIIQNKFVPEARTSLFPDIALFLKYAGVHKERKYVRLCFRNDREKVLENTNIVQIKNWFIEKQCAITCINTIESERFDASQRENKVISKLDEFSNSILVVTDRLHSMIFCAITGTPCIVLDNSTNKVSGVYEWLKHSGFIYLARNIEDVYNNAEKVLESTVPNNLDLQPYFIEMLSRINKFIEGE